MRAMLLSCCLMAVIAAAAEPPTVIDSMGKEVALKKWKITVGARKLAWVEGKPDAFEVREFRSTNFKEGIITLVPFGRIESISYDYGEAATMTVKVAGLVQPLTGSTKFKDTNYLTIEAEIERQGGVVDVRYRGGIKDGIKGVKFSDAKAPPKPEMPGAKYSFVVPSDDKTKPTPTVQTAYNVGALYRLATGEEKVLSYLIFKKTLKVELTNIQKMTVGLHNAKDRTTECELKMKDGTDLSVTLLGVITVDGKPATLLGLLGEVPAGYRVFPVHAFTEMQPGEIKLEPHKELEPKTPPKKTEPKKTPPKKTEPKE